jgi:hypothetical protein
MVRRKGRRRGEEGEKKGKGGRRHEAAHLQEAAEVGRRAVEEAKTRTEYDFLE